MTPRTKLAPLAPLALAYAIVASPGSGVAGMAASAACPAHAYTMALHSWQVKGAVVTAVGFISDTAPGCTLKTTVHLSLRHRSGSPVRSVSGNAAVWRVSARLPLWSRLAHTWTWRNRCGAGRRFVITASANGKSAPANVVAPECRDRTTASRLVDSGSGMRLVPFTGSRIPAHILPPETPIPLSPALIRVSKGWLVSDGRTLVAVYAGAAGNSPSVGRFGIVRQNLVFGLQQVFTVDVDGICALTISAPPLGKTVETSAQRAGIGFSSAAGANGVLHLADDTVTLTP